MHLCVFEHLLEGGALGPTALGRADVHGDEAVVVGVKPKLQGVLARLRLAHVQGVLVDVGVVLQSDDVLLLLRRGFGTSALLLGLCLIISHFLL